MPALQSWADDVENGDFPPRTETTDKDGVTTIVEYRLNDEGKKVKVTRKIRRTLVKTAVNHVVAERMGWTKFGQEKGAASGPGATTTVGENVRLRIHPGGIKAHEAADNEKDEMEAMRSQLRDKKVTCRYCQGDHFTARCPYKDTLGGALGDADTAGPDGDVPSSDDPSAMRAAGSKYVPPSMRSGSARGVGETMNGARGRDDYPTLRVTNLSEDATDTDMWDLFGRFASRGRINRIYVGRDMETGLCKGFGFVSFEDKADAEAAMKKVHGLPYDHLILQVQWSVPKAPTA